MGLNEKSPGLPSTSQKLGEVPRGRAEEACGEVSLGNFLLMVLMSRSQLHQGEIDRIVQMAWEDRTPFDAIQSQFGLTPGEVIKVMRSEMKPASFKLWRARTAGRKTKHVARRGFVFGRFRCPDQKGS